MHERFVQIRDWALAPSEGWNGNLFVTYMVPVVAVVAMVLLFI